MNPEYFPASYLQPVLTAASLENSQVYATFPRSTITGTLEELRQLLKIPLLSESKKISPEVFKAFSLEGASGAPNSADEETAPKRIGVFIKLCSVFIPCKYDEYFHAIAELDSEVNPDLMAAWQPYVHARDEVLVLITNRMAAATSVLLQVLHFLQEGHVEYLLRQYRDAFVDLFGANAVPRERNVPLYRGTTSRVREETGPTPRGTTALVSAGPPRTLRDLGQEPSKVEDDPENDVDMDNDDSGSNFDHTRVDEDDEANTSVSFTTQQEASRLQLETTTTSENTEAADFGSDTSPRTESGDYEELSQAEVNWVYLVPRADRSFPNRPNEGAGILFSETLFLTFA